MVPHGLDQDRAGYSAAVGGGIVQHLPAQFAEAQDVAAAFSCSVHKTIGEQCRGDYQGNNRNDQPGITAGFDFFPYGTEQRQRHEQDGNEQQHPFMGRDPLAHHRTSQTQTGQDDRHLSAEGHQDSGNHCPETAKHLTHRTFLPAAFVKGTARCSATGPRHHFTTFTRAGPRCTVRWYSTAGSPKAMA